MKRVLLIEDLSCYGKCSITVALPILAVAGVEGIPLPTAVFSAHTGVGNESGIVDFSGEMESFFSHFKKLAITFDAILVGYAYGEKQIRAIEMFLDTYQSEKKPFILIDPAMADNGKIYGKLSEDYPERMKELVRRADLMTPNVTEALLLAGRDYTAPPSEKSEVIELLSHLKRTYRTDVIITGLQMNGELLVMGIEGDTLYESKAPLSKRNYSGAGDAFASLYLAERLRGKNFFEAMEEATRLTSLSIKNSVEEGTEYLYFESILKEIR